MNDSSSDPEPSNVRRFGIIISVPLLCVYGLFDYLGDSSLGLVISCITGVFLVALYVKKEMIRDKRFSATMLLLYIVQIIVISQVPLPEEMRGIIMLPICLADLFVIAGVLSMFDRISAKSDRA